MTLMTWWHTDRLPILPALPGFSAQALRDDGLIAELNRLDHGEIRARRRDGHTPFVARLDGIPAAYGWSASRRAAIGELGLRISLVRDERYLWDFATLPAFRGRGIYPHLLQSIIRAEQVARIWILHAPENLPSGTGMIRAGFLPVGRLSFQADGRVALADISDDLRAWWAAETFGIPLAEHVAPCWHCATSNTPCGCRHHTASAGSHCCCAIPVGLKLSLPHAARHAAYAI
ncbi:MAG TPA: hypothetical protein PKA05_12010 [Roseiflexaceae bacterium]|nr:hypothetical protein [Roseiflexaceae bacterium]HMP41099.1 hypothetical protein [Roseiflexaceae bacterium]